MGHMGEELKVPQDSTAILYPHWKVRNLRSSRRLPVTPGGFLFTFQWIENERGVHHVVKDLKRQDPAGG